MAAHVTTRLRLISTIAALIAVAAAAFAGEAAPAPAPVPVPAPAVQPGVADQVEQAVSTAVAEGLRKWKVRVEAAKASGMSADAKADLPDVGR